MSASATFIQYWKNWEGEVGGGAVARQPDRAVLGLAELLAVRAEQQRPGEGVRVPAVGLPDQVDPGQDVAPLVGAADLQLDLMVPAQIEVVVGLQQLRAEVGERDAVLDVEPGLDRLD